MPARTAPPAPSTSVGLLHEERRDPGTGMTSQLQRRSFRAMGTVCEVAVTAGPPDVLLARRALAAAQAEVASCERALSRFDAGSDLSRLNSAAGEWVAVDPLLLDALAAALRGRTDTGGLFDPTILPALVAAGYDRSFELLTDRAAVVLEELAFGRVDRCRPALGSGARRAWRRRRPRRDRQGLRRDARARRDAGRLACAPRRTRRSRRRHRRLRYPARRRRVARGHRRPARARARARHARARERRRRHVRTRHAAVRRRQATPPPHRPGHRRARRGRPALGHGPWPPSATEAEAYATALGIATLDVARDLLASRPDIAALLIPQFGDPDRDRPAPPRSRSPRRRQHPGRTVPMALNAHATDWRRNAPPFSPPPRSSLSL